MGPTVQRDGILFAMLLGRDKDGKVFGRRTELLRGSKGR